MPARLSCPRPPPTLRKRQAPRVHRCALSSATAAASAAVRRPSHGLPCVRACAVLDLEEQQLAATLAAEDAEAMDVDKP